MMKARPGNEETQAPDTADGRACADLDKHTEGGAFIEPPLKWWEPILGETVSSDELEAQYFASGRRRTLQEDPTLRFDELETVVAEEADSPEVIEWREHMFSGIHWISSKMDEFLKLMGKLERMMIVGTQVPIQTELLAVATESSPLVAPNDSELDQEIKGTLQLLIAKQPSLRPRFPINVWYALKGTQPKSSSEIPKIGLYGAMELVYNIYEADLMFKHTEVTCCFCVRPKQSSRRRMEAFKAVQSRHLAEFKPIAATIEALHVEINELIDEAYHASKRRGPETYNPVFDGIGR